ncbi:MAG: helix-turn-helix domain-containing protein [Ilumatobacteraceae bacterium]
MKWSDIASQQCSIARALSVVGDRWTMLVIRELFNGNRRFGGLLTETGAPPAILSERLAGLERDGVVTKRPYSQRADRFEYRLTAQGRDLYPVLVSLMAWGDRWMSDGRPPPVELRHTTCGHHTTPTLHCSACGGTIDPREMQRDVGVDADADRTTPVP